jgi:hypothetical protein
VDAPRCLRLRDPHLAPGQLPLDRLSARRFLDLDRRAVLQDRLAAADLLAARRLIVQALNR